MSRKRFPCGHLGKGKYCHACRAAEIAAEKAAESKATDKKKKALSEAASRLRAMGVTGYEGKPAGVVSRAADLAAGVLDGRMFGELRARRLVDKRHVVAIPVGRNHRLLCIDAGDAILPKELLTHEAYNGRIYQY